MSCVANISCLLHELRVYAEEDKSGFAQECLTYYLGVYPRQIEVEPRKVEFAIRYLLEALVYINPKRTEEMNHPQFWRTRSETGNHAPILDPR
jgi:hypothetical protein